LDNQGGVLEPMSDCIGDGRVATATARRRSRVDRSCPRKFLIGRLVEPDNERGVGCNGSGWQERTQPGGSCSDLPDHGRSAAIGACEGEPGTDKQPKGAAGLKGHQHYSTVGRHLKVNKSQLPGDCDFLEFH